MVLVPNTDGLDDSDALAEALPGRDGVGVDEKLSVDDGLAEIDWVTDSPARHIKQLPATIPRLSDTLSTKERESCAHPSWQTNLMPNHGTAHTQIRQPLIIAWHVLKRRHKKVTAP